MPAGRRIATIAAAVAVTALALIGPMAGLAQAHIGLSASDSAAGHESVLIFRVPTEKDLPTTKVEIAMPAATPLTSVLAEPVPGWIVNVTKAAPAKPVTGEDGAAVTKIVSRLSWTTTGVGIAAGQFQEFKVLADPLPDTEQLVFKVLQTYRDGSVSSWIQEQVKGGPEPDFPAPVLVLSGFAVGATPAAGAAVTATATPSAAPVETSGRLAIVAVAVALLAAIAAAFALLRIRRISALGRCPAVSSGRRTPGRTRSGSPA